jgi:hypothetical protein
MRFARIALKEGLQLLRRPLGLALALLSAPALILVYWLIFSGGPRQIRVAFVDLDGSAATLRLLARAAGSEAGASFSLKAAPDEDALARRIALRDADIGVILPRGFAAALSGGGVAELRVLGDASNPRYPPALAALGLMASAGLEAAGEGAAGPRIEIREEFLGSSGRLGAFDLYVPGLLVISLIMALFPVGLSLQAEKSSGGLRRLRMAGVRSWEMGLGLGLAHLCVCALSFALAFAFARLLGYRGSGNPGAMLLTGCLTGLASVGMGLALGCAAKDGQQVFLLGFLPFVLLTLLSGAAYPMPRLMVLDLLPSTHAVRAMGLILIGRGGTGELARPLASLAASALAYYLGGLGFFTLRYRREGKSL